MNNAKEAINTIIAYIVCTSPKLNCEDDCPLYHAGTTTDDKMECNWTDERVATAVRMLRKSETKESAE